MRTASFARCCSAILLSGFACCLLSAAFAQENHAPAAPGEIAITNVTAHSARVAWGAATDPDGDSLSYHVWLRMRIGGVAQPWLAPQETQGTNLVWDGLSAATVYDVKIAASDGKVFGPARIREVAFETLHEVEGNHPPTVPRGFEFSQLAAHSVKIWWSASTDLDGDPLTYQVSLRKRVEGQVFEWLPATTTSATSLVWDGLEAETLYDARVRASDGKAVSFWFVKESAFRTPAELNAPSTPGEITVSNVTAYAARVGWGPATGPAGVSLVYELQVRGHLRSGLETWTAKAETLALSALATNLHPATVYDVRVRAWAQGVAGGWAVKELAFTTLAIEQANHPPSRPGPVRVSDLTPFSVRLSWEPSLDQDDDSLVYAINLRKRIDNVAQAWSATREVRQASALWEGLTPGTIYEVRIRAWDGKAYSDWYLKENAFVTPTATDRPASFVQAPDPAYPQSQPRLLVTWPGDATQTSLESAGILGSWTPCLEVETDGTNNRALVPMSGDAGFFRVRR